MQAGIDRGIHPHSKERHRTLRRTTNNNVSRYTKNPISPQLLQARRNKRVLRARCHEAAVSRGNTRKDRSMPHVGLFTENDNKLDISKCTAAAHAPRSPRPHRAT